MGQQNKCAFALTIVCSITLVAMGVVLLAIYPQLQAELKDLPPVKAESRNDSDLFVDQINIMKKQLMKKQKIVEAALKRSIDQTLGLKSELNEYKESAKNQTKALETELNESKESAKKQITDLQTELKTSNDKIAAAENKIEKIQAIATNQASDEVKLKMCSTIQQPSEISDGKLTVSSSYNPNCAPKYGRLFSKTGHGCWCTKHNPGNEWIQVDYSKNKKFFSVVTQGDYNHDVWVTSFTISYKKDSGTFNSVTDASGNAVVFPGNTDQITPVVNSFPQAIIARYIRIIPVTVKKEIGLRFDILCC